MKYFEMNVLPNIVENFSDNISIKYYIYEQHFVYITIFFTQITSKWILFRNVALIFLYILYSDI